MHMALHVVRYTGLNEGRLVTLVIALCIVQAVFAKNIVTYFQDSPSVDDPFEEQVSMRNAITHRISGDLCITLYYQTF